MIRKLSGNGFVKVKKNIKVYCSMIYRFVYVDNINYLGYVVKI